MLVLGLDPSLTNFGWALHDTDATGLNRCISRGRFQTSSKTLYISRYQDLRERLRTLIQKTNPDRMGIEFPVFGDLYSEGLYGLFLYCSEAIKEEFQDVVFWSPLQIKAHARESLSRPKGWVMMKPDMVEAAKADTGGSGVWNHNEADAYLCARLSSRFWLFYEGLLLEPDLTPVERKYFTEIKQYTRGKKEGKEEKKGLMYRENERFFKWSEVLNGNRNDRDKGTKGSQNTKGEGTQGDCSQDWEVGDDLGCSQESSED